MMRINIKITGQVEKEEVREKERKEATLRGKMAELVTKTKDSTTTEATWDTLSHGDYELTPSLEVAVMR